MNNFSLILASKSPRRQFLLRELGFKFEVRTKETDESFPKELKAENIPLYLAKKKSEAFSEPTIDIEEPMEIHYSYVEQHLGTTAKKVYSKRTQRVMKFWKRYGLAGIAFLTPVLISIPIGTIILNNMIHDRKKIFLYMFVSILFWSLLLNLFFEIYHIRREGWLQ